MLLIKNAHSSEDFSTEGVLHITVNYIAIEVNTSIIGKIIFLLDDKLIFIVFDQSWMWIKVHWSLSELHNENSYESLILSFGFSEY